MRRCLTIAAFVAALLALPAWGQMRGGRMGGSGFRSGFAPRGRMFVHGGFGFRPHSRFFFPRNRFSSGSRFFFGGSFFAGPAYYPAYGGYPYPVAVQTAPPPAYYPDEYAEQGDLRRDVDALSGKVDRLREDVDARLPVPRPPSKTRAEAAPEPATVLVFKDHHTREVQNYAVVGGTLWVFSEQRSEKISLSTLDVDATAKLNDERGVDFRLPQ
jgi:hypothetical protein